MKQLLTDNEHVQVAKSGFWTNRKWFTFVALFLLAWIGLYLFAHLEKVHGGYQYTRFTTPQIQQINRILYENNQNNTVDNKAENATAVVEYDTVSNDSIIEVSRPVAAKQIAPANICDDSCHISKAMIYIRSEFDNKINEDQLSVIRQYISSFGSQEVGLFLAEIKVKIKSYFWLTGPFVYLEVVFWVIIGVACSILFAIGNSSREKGTTVAFSDKDIPYQIAKLFYAPCCTIILVLSYNYIKHRNVIEVNTNEGMIVFSFISGLFSGRLMSLLERFKDVLLPEHTVTAPATPLNSNLQYNGIGAIAAPAPQMPSPKAITTFKSISEEEQEDSRHEEEGDDEDTVPTTQEDIKQVAVELKLDVGGLFEEEKEELLATGFSTAVVTLHNVNGKEILTLKYADGNSRDTFVVDNVKPGIYIARSTMTRKLSDNYVINLFGERTAYFTHENNDIELYIKRYEAID